MKKHTLLLFLSLVSVFTFGQNGKLEKVINAHNKTIPIKKFIKFKTYFWQGVINQNEVMKMDFQLSQEKGKALMVMDGESFKVVQGINLEEMKPWTYGPDGSKVEITDPATIGGLIGFANPYGDLGGENIQAIMDRYTTLEYGGTENVDGVAYEIVESMDEYGTKKKHFINSRSKLLEITETTAGGVTASVRFSNFVTQEGITLPWTYTITSGTGKMVFNITNLELGKEMDPSQYNFY